MRIRLQSGEFVYRPSLCRIGLGIEVLDQRLLPGMVEFLTVDTLPRMEEAIKTLAVRGAPAIGSFAAFSLAICWAKGIDPDIAYDRLAATRPTAVDLRNCMDRTLSSGRRGGPEAALAEADSIYTGIIDSCKAIGENGVSLFKKGARILTHCNAGALATIEWGTALAPIRSLARAGKEPFVWVSETRPLLQGSRLTAWELSMEGIEHRIVIDSACAHLMREGMVDAVIVGADRVCANGDIANKIGTLDKAILAREFDVPFYVAFPYSTLDPTCRSGDMIPIEERSHAEIANWTSDAWNPAFDWTPARYITSFITERGIVDPREFEDCMR